MNPVFCFLFFFFIFILDLRKGTEFRFSFLGYSAFMGNNNDNNDRYSLIHYGLILNYGPLYISLPNLPPDLFDALLQQRASIIKIATHKTRLHRLWSYTLQSWLLRVVRQFAYYYRLLNAVQSAPMAMQFTTPKYRPFCLYFNTFSHWTTLSYSIPTVSLITFKWDDSLAIVFSATSYKFAYHK
jgi:hypothetical protein